MCHCFRKRSMSASPPSRIRFTGSRSKKASISHSWWQVRLFSPVLLLWTKTHYKLLNIVLLLKFYCHLLMLFHNFLHVFMTVCLLWNTKEDLLKNVDDKTVLVSIDWFYWMDKNTMEVNAIQDCLLINILQEIFFCVPHVKERKACRFGTTRGWVNYDFPFFYRILIYRICSFGWTIQLN